MTHSIFDQILERLNEQGEFTAAVLASENGWPVASAPAVSAFNPDTVAAMVTLVKDFIQQTQRQLRMPDVDEVSIVVGDRSRLVCRYFDASGDQFVLAIIAPPHANYRRLTSHAIAELKHAWAE